MAKGQGNTIIVAGGSGGSKGGGSGSGNGGSSKPSSSKGGNLKINDQMFSTALMVLVGVGAVAYIYYSRPDLVHEFLGPVLGKPAIPAPPAGTVQNDVLPQQSAGVAPEPTQGQWGGQMQYPGMPISQQQSTGQGQFQYPQQSPNTQQYQPYQPTDYGGTQTSTSFNPTFGQNSNQPTYSFASRRISQLEYDSSDGMLRQV